MADHVMNAAGCRGSAGGENIFVAMAEAGATVWLGLTHRCEKVKFVQMFH